MRHTYSLAIAASLLPACSSRVAAKRAATPRSNRPRSSTKVDGINKVTLTEKAMERLDVKTTPLREGKDRGRRKRRAATRRALQRRDVRSDGDTFVYTSPKPRTFVRQAVEDRLHRRRHGRAEDRPAGGHASRHRRCGRIVRHRSSASDTNCEM